MFAYWPATAVPVAVQVVDAPGASWLTGHTTEATLSSVTTTLVNVTLPVFLTS